MDRRSGGGSSELSGLSQDQLRDCLPKHFRAIEQAVGELEKRGRLTPELQQRARAAKERLAPFRAQKKLDEAEVAEAGGNAKKAVKLRAEAKTVLAQDWPRAFPAEEIPPAQELGEVAEFECNIANGRAASLHAADAQVVRQQNSTTFERRVVEWFLQLRAKPFQTV